MAQFSVPGPDLQPFNVAQVPPQEPLGALAKIAALRTQRLQQENAQLDMELRRSELDSQKNLLRAMVDDYQQTQLPAASQPSPAYNAPEGGVPDTTGSAAPQPQQPTSYLDRVRQRAVQYGVLPKHIQEFETHALNLRKDLAEIDVKQKSLLDSDIDHYRNLLTNVANLGENANQAALDAANRQAKQQDLFRSGKLPPLTQFTDIGHLKAFADSLIGMKELNAEQKEQAATEASKAQTAELNTKTAGERRGQAIAEFQAAQADDGSVSDADMFRLQNKYKDVAFPVPGNKAAVARFIRSGMATEKQPEFDIKTRQAELGLLGNDKWDQFLLQHARSLKKTPSQLTPEEFQQGLQKYAELTQDPTIRALLIGQKGLEQQMTRAQVASLPTPQDIEYQARQLVNGDMSLDDLRNFRTRNINTATPALRRAEEIVKAEGNPMFPGQPFSVKNLETALDTREKAETAFGPGPKGDMIRSNNNSIEHLGLLDDARKALGTNNIPLMRSVAQTLGIEFGSDLETTYDTIAKRVGDEVTKSFVPGAGGEAERLAASADFKRQLGNKQIENNIKATLHLMDSQTRNLEAQYERSTFGKGLQTGKFWTPRAMETRDRLLGKTPTAGQLKVGDPVTFEGKKYIYKGINPKTGKAILDEQ